VPTTLPGTCSTSSLSCSANADSCCVPDNGLLVLALQWLPGWCAANTCGQDVKSSIPDGKWTIHGLWPDLCSGARPPSKGCDTTRNQPSIDSIVKSSPIYADMLKYWISYKG
ncbi:ribonuclease T2, partial [Rhizoclosmatium globosum]